MNNLLKIEKKKTRLGEDTFQDLLEEAKRKDDNHLKYLRVLNKLPQVQKLIFLLYIEEDYSVKNVAKRLNVSNAYVYKSIDTTRKRLREVNKR